MNIAIVGATGMVGRKMIEVLEERKVMADNYFPFASKKSAGKKLKINGKKCVVLELNEENIKANKCDYAVFSAGGERSKQFAPVFASMGCIVIDNSSYWRQNKDVPLVVPEVNPEDLKKHGNIIANPNCSTIQVVVPLKALDDKFVIKRIVYSTYQAVSGAGVEGYNDLANGVKGKAPTKFKYPIFNNVIPQIDDFLPNGNTKEEEKMINETRKILHKPEMRISATTVRVPVFNSHSISVNVEFEKPITRESATKELKKMPGVVVVDDTKNCIYPMPINSTGKDECFVGRIRVDSSVEHGLNFFVCADNIRKGAATNAIQILEYFLKKGKK